LIRKIYIILQDFSRKLAKENINAHAASIAFFFFLSIVPILIVICTIIPYTPLTDVDLVSAITELTPSTLDPLVESLVGDVYDKSAGILSIAVITTLWSAGKGILALIRGLNTIDSVTEERNYFVVRAVCSFYTLVMLIVMILSVTLMVFGSQVRDFILRSVPQAYVLNNLLMRFRFLFVWLILTILFGAVYAYLPNKKLRFKEQLPGAAFSAVVWNIYSWGFSVYLRHTDAYSIYGSLSLIIIFLIWLYFCMYIIMIGAYINLYFSPVSKMLWGNKSEMLLGK